MLNTIRQLGQRLFGTTVSPHADAPDAVNDAVAQWQDRFLRQKATYDAARTTNEFSRYWANADRHDADSAHLREVRHTLISRSRYELNNNGFGDGIAQTYATHLVGTGPVLRMQSGSEGFNRMVELTWFLWAKAIHFRRKLWCMAHAKHSDGEAFGVLRRNPNVRHPIPLDIVLVEAEQVQTPYLPFGEDGRIDGVKFDRFGNPVWYEILRKHPGSTNDMSFELEPEQVPASAVLHWFRMRRPGQHRGVPEMASTLNTGAAARRWREATLAAAETAADFAVLMKTQATPDGDSDPMAPFTTMDIEKRMMAALPMGWDATQLKAEHPTATYESFHRSLVNEMARPKSMPYNVAACDSSSYNYASGRLDHQTYYGSLDVDREDANDLVLDPLFDTWFDLAVSRFGWLGGDPDAINGGARIHVWDWPKHRVADIEAEANANRTKLESGQTGLYRLYSDAGMDAEDELEKEAALLGVSVAELKSRLMDVLYPPVQQGGAVADKKRDLVEAIQKIYLGVGTVITDDEARVILNRFYDAQLPPGGIGNDAPEAVEAMLRSRGILNGNGAKHG